MPLPHNQPPKSTPMRGSSTIQSCAPDPAQCMARGVHAHASACTAFGHRRLPCGKVRAGRRPLAP